MSNRIETNFNLDGSKKTLSRQKKRHNPIDMQPSKLKKPLKLDSKIFSNISISADYR